MLIMRKHRNAKWDRKSRKCMKETVRDSDKFSGPFVLLTENVMHELKLHCWIRSGAGHGGTFHCNEMQNGVWFGWCWGLHPDRCYEPPACTSAGSLWLPHTKSKSRGTYNAIPPSRGHSLLCHIVNSLRKRDLNPLHLTPSLRQLSEQISAFLGCFQNPAPIP